MNAGVNVGGGNVRLPTRTALIAGRLWGWIR